MYSGYGSCCCVVSQYRGFCFNLSAEWAPGKESQRKGERAEPPENSAQNHRWEHKTAFGSDSVQETEEI